MTPGSVANSFQGVISAASTYGIVDAISTDEITTTSGANPSIVTDSLSLTLSTSAGTFSHARMPGGTFSQARLTAGARAGARVVPLGTLRTGTVARPMRPTASVREPDDRRLFRSFRAIPRQAAATGRSVQGFRRASALPVTQGSTTSFYVNTAAIGQAGTNYISIPATLQAVSNHGYIWIDNSLSLSQASITQIATDFDNAYGSDSTHFASPEYTTAQANAQGTIQPCDASGTPIPGANPVAAIIPPPNGMHVVFVANTNTIGSGLGGEFSFINFLPQGVANCLAGQPKSNEASMITVGYNPALGDSTEINEDLVRGTAHEFQHLINYVNHVVISKTSPEDTWINEGLSMLAQDFAVNALFPSVPVDVDTAVADAEIFLTNPQNFSLTGFTGIDNPTISQALAYSCNGCYGASYLFERYLYDQYGGDTYLHRMELNGQVSYTELQTATGQNPAALIENFSVALAASNSGLSTVPQFNFTGFNPYGTYIDQFGQSTTLAGPGVVLSTVGQPNTYNPFLGTFVYLQANVTSGQGSGVTLSDPSGQFGLASALIQF